MRLGRERLRMAPLFPEFFDRLLVYGKQLGNFGLRVLLGGTGIHDAGA
jgi:hypothetical protein